MHRSCLLCRLALTASTQVKGGGGNTVCLHRDVLSLKLACIMREDTGDEAIEVFG